MNRTNLRRLAEERVIDAKILLDCGQWSGAYYLAGYAVECGLKSCVLAHVERTGMIFLDKRFLENCWTHDIEKLVKAAGLKDERDMDVAANPDRKLHWQHAKSWNETSRYMDKNGNKRKGTIQSRRRPDPRSPLMDQDSLVNEEIEEGARFLTEFNKKYPVRAAYWRKPTEDAQWYLYVISDQINDKNIKDGYREVSRLDKVLLSPYFDLFRIRLISSDAYSRTAALDFYRRYSWRFPGRFAGKSFCGISVDNAYIYATPEAVLTS